MIYIQVFREAGREAEKNQRTSQRNNREKREQGGGKTARRSREEIKRERETETN